jgi:hypothetical protein
MDCLASTGLPVLTWVVLGAAAVSAGLITWFFLRKAGRRSTAALAVALVLAAGGVTLGAVTAPPASAATLAASCRAENGANGGGGNVGVGGVGSTSTVSSTVTVAPTNTAGPTSTPTVPEETPIATTPPPSADPIDLTPTVTADPTNVTVMKATSLTYTLTVNSVLSSSSTGPVTVLIEKHPEQGTGATFVGTNWTVDQTSDPANFIATFAGTIPGKSSSNVLIVNYPRFTVASGQVFLGALIKTGSGGDGTATNNYAGVTIRSFIPLSGEDSQ